MVVEKLIGELFEKVYALERLVKEEKAELVVKDNCFPGGDYLIVRRLPNGGVAIERGEYGLWQEALTIHREEKWISFLKR